MHRQILTSDRWLLSTTGEVALNLAQPLSLIVDSTGIGKISTDGDLLILLSDDAEPANEIEINFDLLPGTPIVVVGTQGTLKILN